MRRVKCRFCRLLEAKIWFTLVIRSILEMSLLMFLSWSQKCEHMQNRYLVSCNGLIQVDSIFVPSLYLLLFLPIEYSTMAMLTENPLIGKGCQASGFWTDKIKRNFFPSQLIIYTSCNHGGICLLLLTYLLYRMLSYWMKII